MMGPPPFSHLLPQMHVICTFVLCLRHRCWTWPSPAWPEGFSRSKFKTLLWLGLSNIECLVLTEDQHTGWDHRKRMCHSTASLGGDFKSICSDSPANHSPPPPYWVLVQSYEEAVKPWEEYLRCYCADRGSQPTSSCKVFLLWSGSWWVMFVLPSSFLRFFNWSVITAFSQGSWGGEFLREGNTGTPSRARQTQLPSSYLWPFV